MQASALGGGRDGVLAKHVVLDQFNLLPIPAHMNYRQAASLPVAGLTAYHCLLGFPKTVQQGQTVLIEGTGGVSIAALQIALAAGARPIVISSSDDKLKLCQNLGVHKDDCINYSNDKNWWQTVRARTPRGEGVDHTVEIAGGSTLNRALMATKAYGSVWVVVSPRPSSSPVAIATSTNSALSRVQGYMDDYKSTKDSGDGAGAGRHVWQVSSLQSAQMSFNGTNLSCSQQLQALPAVPRGPRHRTAQRRQQASLDQRAPAARHPGTGVQLRRRQEGL
ncbi:hypothetical protein Golomagni_06931 [Golovinomyces magnicellulatus]|nr:hypothetical protein Golomagni_06931 [Golovinomyces magnicellulatus]